MIALVALMVAAPLPAATNDLTSLLQQGLFEEEANRNLDAAIASYQSLAAQFDKNRQIAVTAVFRLGVCYRKQGKTNDAVAQYQRIVRDFGDQQTLATLSRQNLTGLGAGNGALPGAGDKSDANLLDRLRKLPDGELEQILPTLLPDAFLTSLQQQRSQAEEKLMELGRDYSPDNPIRKNQQAVVDLLNKRIAERVDGIMKALQMRVAVSSQPADRPEPPATAPADDEDQEIRRNQAMMQNSPDLINSPNGNHPLIRAADAGWLKVAAFLLDHGADVNAAAGGEGPNPFGRTALHHAAAFGNKAMVELLLSRGAEVNAKGDDGRTPLYLATERGFQAIVEVLLANKADVNVSYRLTGNTPIHLAANRGRTRIVQLLLAAGANPNVEDGNGRMPLSFAVESGSTEIVRILLAAKADPNGGTLDAPLLAAIQKQNGASAELLLKSGANPNGKGTIEWSNPFNGTDSLNKARPSVTPLWLSISTKQLPMVKLLLKYKADPNDDLDRVQGEPLVFVALPNPDILEALLDAGGKVDSHLSEGKTLLDQAINGNSAAAAVEILLKHGADPNARDLSDNRPLHYAVWASVYGKQIELLLDHGADPNVRNNNGQTPLDVIKDKMAQSNIDSGARASLTEIAALLRSHGALDHLPHWDRITVSRPSADFSRTVFREGTNDWNRFTLLETILNYYELQKMNSIPFGSVPGAGDSAIATMAFPDLARVVIARYTPGTTNETRIKINLLNSTNGIDCSKDVPLEFGDVVEIPEREHTLAESDENTPAVRKAILDFLRSKAGSIRLIIAGGQTIQVPLDDFEPDRCYLGNVLQSPQAQNVLTTDSDFSRVKVTHRDPATGRKREWILHVSHWLPASNQIVVIPQRFGMSNPQSAPEPNLWLRDGDVIEVPEK
jgi:ankyrin repeat protein